MKNLYILSFIFLSLIGLGFMFSPNKANASWGSYYNTPTQYNGVYMNNYGGNNSGYNNSSYYSPNYYIPNNYNIGYSITSYTYHPKYYGSYNHMNNNNNYNIPLNNNNGYNIPAYHPKYYGSYNYINNQNNYYKAY